MPAEEIKVVVVAMFEPASGRQGELTRFREGLRLHPWNLPGTQPGEAWRNDDGVAALVAGVGPVKTATSLLAFALLADVDFRRTYWLISGIAGGNPSTSSLGSPLWAEWVVDGDAAYDFHPADHPSEWETGILPLGAVQPYGPMACDPSLFGNHDQVFHLNGPLVAWAYNLTRHLPLLDPPGLAAARAPYAGFGAGGLPPAVGCGDVLSAARFWHGARHHAWAEKWVPHWTGGRGRFATSSMEDIGTLGALAQLGRLGRADPRRVLLLRSVSNYTLPPPGIPAYLNLAGNAEADPQDIFPGLEASLENGWRAGHAVIRALLDGWPRWCENPPEE